MNIFKFISRFFKTKSDYIKIVDELEKKIELIGKTTVPIVKHVLVMPPQESDIEEFNRNIGNLISNPHFAYYFNQMISEITDNLTFNNKESPDFYRGQLNLVAKIKSDAMLAVTGKYIDVKNETTKTEDIY